MKKDEQCYEKRKLCHGKNGKNDIKNEPKTRERLCGKGKVRRGVSKVSGVKVGQVRCGTVWCSVV